MFEMNMQQVLTMTKEQPEAVHVRTRSGKLVKNIMRLGVSTSKYPKAEDVSKTVLLPYVITRQQRRAIEKPWKHRPSA